MLIANGVKLVAEVSNMGCTPEAIKASKMLNCHWPCKAVNAGGVATSGLENDSKNSYYLAWRVKGDAKLQLNYGIIHNACLKYGQEDGIYQLT